MAISFRFLVLGTVSFTTLAGCNVLSSIVSPVTSGGEYAACRDYVAHVNQLEGCLGLSYDVDNYCAGQATGLNVDWQPFYACLVANTRCEGGEPTMEYDDCVAPLLSRSQTPLSTP